MTRPSALRGGARLELLEDLPSRTNDGRSKRWVVVRPPHTETGILLARADGADQEASAATWLSRYERLWAESFDRLDDHVARLTSEQTTTLNETQDRER